MRPYNSEMTYTDCMCQGERRIASIQDSVDASIQRLEHYIERAEYDWIQPPETI